MILRHKKGDCGSYKGCARGGNKKTNILIVFTNIFQIISLKIYTNQDLRHCFIKNMDYN